MPLVIAESGSNAVEMFATRIDVQWDFKTNTGPVLFHYERVDWDRETKMVNTRNFERTIRQDITGLIDGEYAITHPVTGEQLTEPGWKLMAMIKAATERVWDDETAPPSILIPDGEPSGKVD
jgi:hypothetical protein